MHGKHPLCVSAFVGMHQYNFDSGRQNEKKTKKKRKKKKKKTNNT